MPNDIALNPNVGIHLKFGLPAPQWREMLRTPLTYEIKSFARKSLPNRIPRGIYLLWVKEDEMRTRMTMVLLVTLVVLICGVAAVAQTRINLRSPIKEFSYEIQPNSNNVTIKATLRTTEEPAVESIPVASFRVKNLRVTNQESISGNALMDKLSDTVYVFTLQILSNQSAPPVTGGFLSLKPNWESLSCSINFSFDDVNGHAKDGESAAFVIRKTLVSPSTESIEIRNPIWEIDDNGKTQYLAIPILARNDIRLSVALKNSAGIPVADGQDLVTFKSSGQAPEPHNVQLRLKPGVEIVPNENYTVEVTSLRSGTNVTPHTRTFQAQSNRYYKLRDLKPLTNLSHNYSDAARPLEFDIETTTSGALRMVFDRLPKQVLGTPGTRHHFVVDLTGVPNGSYSFHFEGVGDNGQKFLDSKESFSLTLDTRTRLLGNTDFSLDEKTNRLKIKFNLNRNVRATISFPEFGKVGVIGIAPNDKNPQKDDQGNLLYSYETEINVDAASQLVQSLQPKVKETAVVPIVLRILSDEPEVVAAFTLRAVRIDQAKLLQSFEDASKKTNEEDQRKVLRAGLGVAANAAETPDEKDAIDHMIRLLKDKPAGKTKFVSFLKLAGKVAAGYFGIPIPS